MSYRLNRPLVLEQAQVVADLTGGHTVNWVALGTIWAEIRPGAGRERRGDIAPTGEMVLRLFVRAAPLASPQRPRPDQRLRDGARVFRVLAVSEADARGAYLLIHAREEVPA